MSGPPTTGSLLLPQVANTAATSYLLSAVHSRVSLQDFASACKVPCSISRSCLCHCLQALSSVSLLGNYEALGLVGCSPTPSCCRLLCIPTAIVYALTISHHIVRAVSHFTFSKLVMFSHQTDLSETVVPTHTGESPGGLPKPQTPPKCDVI